MFDVVLGQKRNPASVAQLTSVLTKLQPSGTLYIGYPVIPTADEPIVIEALLTCLEYGVVVFDFYAPSQTFDVKERQDDLYNAIAERLRSFKPLRAGRELAIGINVVTLTPVSGRPRNSEGILASAAELPDVLANFDSISMSELSAVNAAIQRITTIKPQNKRATVTRADSRGAIMAKIEKEIANLDQWQKAAAIESPEAPQRVRGLAGSGKTVVLALKAAYLHAQHPEWDIAVTFHTRSLKQHFKDLIRRFSFEHLKDEPDWSKLRILQTWGSRSNPGVYAEIANGNQAPAMDFLSAKSAFGYDGAFEGACKKLLTQVKKQPTPVELFDAVLIDEAQDLPQAFFELVYLATRDPKRIVWAYDELQNLGSHSMVPAAELFGKNGAGKPNVSDLISAPGEARRDIILPICYRNTPWALTTAHAVGFGVYRKTDGLVQYFDDSNLWLEVGYEVTGGHLEPGKGVALRRAPDSYPTYFTELLKQTDAVVSKVFDSSEEQATAVAAEIALNVSDDELDLRDIVVILPNPLTASEEAAHVIRALSKFEIPAHIAGVTASVDQLFQDKSVAITGIYRAKGNEAPMVYILNSQYGSGGSAKRRNILFTAITRSRAWVRIYGFGERMDALKAEIDSVHENGNALRFKVPTEAELEQMRTIHRDMSRKELAVVQKAQKGIQELLGLIESGQVDPDSLPPDLRRSLRLK